MEKEYPIVTKIKEKFGEQNISVASNGIMVCPTNHNYAIVGIKFNPEVYLVELASTGELSINARCNNAVNQSKEGFIRLERYGTQEECILSAKDFLTIGKLRVFDFIDSGVRESRLNNVVFRYYRKEAITRIWNSDGELIHEVPAKVVSFCGYHHGLCVTESETDSEYCHLYSLKNKKNVSDDLLYIDIEMLRKWPYYYSEDGTRYEDYTAFEKDNEDIVVFDNVNHTVVKTIPKHEVFDEYHLIKSNGALSFYAVRKANRWNILFGNSLISKVWFSSYKVYDDMGFTEEDEDFCRPEIIKCFDDESDFDILDLGYEQCKGKAFNWRYSNFN